MSTRCFQSVRVEPFKLRVTSKSSTPIMFTKLYDGNRVALNCNLKIKPKQMASEQNLRWSFFRIVCDIKNLFTRTFALFALDNI